MKHLAPSASVILALTILLATLLACKIGQTEEQATLFDQFYAIDPTSLLETLKNGDINAFTPVSEDIELLPVDQQLPIDWLQEDYFFIANTLYENVLGKSLQGWQLNSMDFSSRCSYVHNGFQNGRFEFFRVIREKEQESRIIRFIDIDTRGNFVYVREQEFYPNLTNLEAIDLAQLKISAERAFQIAENRGGEEKRQSVENACNISLVLSPGPANERGWKVSYTRSDNSITIFHVEIDPITGETYFP